MFINIWSPTHCQNKKAKVTWKKKVNELKEIETREMIIFKALPSFEFRRKTYMETLWISRIFSDWQVLDKTNSNWEDVVNGQYFYSTWTYTNPKPLSKPIVILPIVCAEWHSQHNLHFSFWRGFFASNEIKFNWMIEQNETKTKTEKKIKIEREQICLPNNSIARSKWMKTQLRHCNLRGSQDIDNFFLLSLTLFLYCKHYLAIKLNLLYF